jgi:predicted unusual protein kinase regulating ubiquinone biosynthesis (AarF/ABC1/UbiB family)
MDQESIPSTKFSRIVALTGAGAKVSMNYLKHYGKRALGGKVDSERLHERNATAIYKTFSEIKGGPLKLAQMLSIDKNLLPPAYAKEFAQAQYSAPPLSYPLVVRTFHREFGKSPTELFDTFTQNAAHGASIGQVHRATIGDRAFAVKVQYPGVAKSLQSDLNFIKPIALQILGLKESQIAPYIAEVEKRLLEDQGTAGRT